MAIQNLSTEWVRCKNCAHFCLVKRAENQRGFCNLNSNVHIAKICLHKGEEPMPNSEMGVCNVFFSQCNLRCVYCQNWQISQPESNIASEITSIDEAVRQIEQILRQGVNYLGFVSPTSHIHHVISIVETLHSHGFQPKVIYNTNSFDSVETLRLMKPFIDVYLPDFKYANNALAFEFSSVKNYVEVATKALQEMYRQKQSKISEENPSLIVRHLVLPNHVENSLQCLEIIKRVCGTNVFVSLMSQYFPNYEATKIVSLNRTITQIEYEIVLKKLDELGFEWGWTQELESNDFYQPDFNAENPFGE